MSDESLSDPTLLLCPDCGNPLQTGPQPHKCEKPTVTHPTAILADTGDAPAHGGTLKPGEELCEGRYRIVRLLGRGAMGEVYLAGDTASTLGAPVVLKLIHPRWLGEEAYVQRFRREAEAARLLKHDAIVRVNYLAQDKARDFLVMEMEYAGDRTLKDLLRVREEKRLPAPEALEIARQVLAGLAHAHGKGVVHRDIKPSNLIMAPDGSVRIADFGLAKLTERVALDATLTGSRGPMGTPNYWSPEQQRDAKHVDARSDLYSTGVVLYEMLTGQIPNVDFQTPLRRAGVAEALDAVILTALRHEPEDRYASAGAFLKALESLRGSAAVATVRATPARGTPVRKSDAKPRDAIRVSPDLPGAFRTIGEGVAAAADGGTVLVGPGTYEETLVVTRPVVVEADGPAGTVLVQSAGPVCVSLEGGATLRGLAIRNLAGKETTQCGAVALRGGACRLERCDIAAQQGVGVLVLEGGGKPVLWKCRIHTTKLFGVYFGAQGGGTMEGCEVYRTGSTGIMVGSKHVRLRGCRIHDTLAGAGIELDHHGATTLEACEIRKCAGSGLAIRRGSAGRLVDSIVHENAPPQVATEEGAKLVLERSHVEEPRRRF
ncbi:MAG: protein kinase [Planctomycetes bacterium]|nr:protein kinase [Planctomycetota bacterium]